MDDGFADDEYRRIVQGGWIQKDLIRQTWRENHPRHSERESPSILSLIRERDELAEIREVIANAQANEAEAREKQAGGGTVFTGEDPEVGRGSSLEMENQDESAPSKSSGETIRECPCGCGSRVGQGRTYFSQTHRWRHKKRLQRGRNRPEG